MRCYSETEPRVHTGGIAFDGCIDKFSHPSEFNDLIELPRDLLPFHAQDAAVQIDVFPSGEVQMESGADFDERAQPAMRRHTAPGWAQNAAQQFERGTLAGTVGTYDGEGLTAPDLKTDVP